MGKVIVQGTQQIVFVAHSFSYGIIAEIYVCHIELLYLQCAEIHYVV